ncbi:MAG: 50S ribosomal protein L20 [Tissierellia bacterium]|nr:50S ribosomal protein L20 [Tissierellia bacterium]
MARVKGGAAAHKRHKKILTQAKGYYGSKSKLFRTANQAVTKSLTYAFIGRKQRKRDFRKLWITRINAAARLHGLSYSKLMHGLKLANIEINRKNLSEMAIHDPDGFKQLVEIAKNA